MHTVLLPGKPGVVFGGLAALADWIVYFDTLWQKSRNKISEIIIIITITSSLMLRIATSVHVSNVAIVADAMLL